MAEIPMAALAWVSSGDTGVSSKAIWSHMVGVKPDRTWRHSNHPHDPDDLGRCLRLLQRVPLWELRMYEMAEHGPVWAALASRWQDLRDCMADEVGIDWSKGRRAPRTYALMQEIICAAEAAPKEPA